MMRSTAIAVLLTASALAGPRAYGASSTCQESYLSGEAPNFAKLAAVGPTRELCFREFAILHSGTSRTPLWSGEHLTAAQVQDAEAMSRTDRFHAERKLPKTERSELSDYRRSGFDRGHMAPSGDMPSAASQRES
ncbi:MAG: DNA/RNA non-specific endonuclease, partial [Methylobacterium mesophilicum]|nr:DNA/RNA non-specific endonuclease [Methylobacterium mesophilicum]